MEGDSPYFDSDTFVGRTEALHTLASGLLKGRYRTAWISGPPGVGKTALAFSFGEQNARSFPGGIFDIGATRLDSFTLRSIDALPVRQGRHLLVLNDVEPDFQPHLLAELERKEFLSSEARVIVTSRVPPPRSSTFADIDIALAGLQHGEMNRLLAELGVPPHVVSRLNGVQSLLDTGSPIVAKIIANALATGSLTPEKLTELLDPFEVPGIIGPDGAPLSANSEEHARIITDVKSVSEELLRTLSTEPRRFYDLTPRRFEEVIAELLDRLGYDITLTPASKDGGKDIYAARQDHLGTFLYIVECKRYAPDRPVGVGLIRQLNGVVQAEQATAGILATTSFFTIGAKEFQREIPSQLSLKDYMGIQGWLKAALKR